MSRHGFEWVYRLALEPRRLAIRLKYNPRFVIKCLVSSYRGKTERFFPKTSRACSFPPARRAALFKIDAED
jgi:hypothetical protein